MADHMFISIINIINIYKQIYFQVITQLTSFLFSFSFFYLQVVEMPN